MVGILAAMTAKITPHEATKAKPMSDPDTRRDARNKLLGRILIVALGVLALAQIVPAIINR